ncbi:glycosyltransferase, partial [Verrucomicrobia bacterium]|nr:glycosyltransferase [Verrucomicrobiota bacterium]
MFFSKKKCVIVQYSSNHGGSTISGLMLARALLSRGWEVHVIFGFSGAFEAIMQQEGCSTEVVPHGNWLRSGAILQYSRNWWKAIQKAVFFAQLLQARQANLVYVNSLVSFEATRGAHLARIPTIWHLRELYDDCGGEMCIPSLLGKKTVYRMIRSHADQLVCTSDAVVNNI